MVSFHAAHAMPVTLTLKNIPDAVYERLKMAAEAHHRSLNSEVIVCLETLLLPSKINPIQRVNRARELRSELVGKDITALDIDALKNNGRL